MSGRGYTLSIGGVPVPSGIDVSIEPPETFYQSQARRLVYWGRLSDQELENRDREWVKAQIGDVPTRWVHGHRTMDDFPTGSPDYFGETVPVDSLGRDSDG